LVDALGGEREAIAWLEQEKKIGPKLPVREWKKERSLERLGIFGVSAAFFQLMGWDGAAARLERISHLGEARLLDGLVSVWQVAPVD
jgi:protease-4